MNGKLAISGRLRETLSVQQGQEAALIASLNALAAAKEHLGDLDRLFLSALQLLGWDFGNCSGFSYLACQA